jgi:beta-lactamase regulating signal transducer with metallopeptidase domain
LWLPAFPAAIAFATLIGWRLQEPDRTDELLRPAGILFALPFALIWLRALARAIRALRRPRIMPPAATVGLLRPRVVIDERLHGALDAPALAAVVAHEQAHAAHRDPLRIWLAQLLTDVQWSSPWARRRLDGWMAALEMARDEEARLRGTRGEDLAAAVVAVARLRPVAHGHAVASLTGTEAALMDRVRRLLIPVPVATAIRSPAFWIFLALLLGSAVVVGIECGDSILRALPFVTT